MHALREENPFSKLIYDLLAYSFDCKCLRKSAFFNKLKPLGKSQDNKKKEKKKKKTEIPNVGEDVESEPLCTTVKWCSHYGKEYDVSSKN